MKALILLSKGYEEVEAITVIDYLRRADIEVDIVATEGDLNTVGAHGIQIKADKLLDDIKAEDYTMLITPGGLDGTEALAENPKVINLLQKQYAKKGENQAYIASICASPLVLTQAEIAQEITGTIYPGMADQAKFKSYDEKSLVAHDKDKQVITSQGPATAVYFALEIIETMKGKAARDEVAEGLLLEQVEATIKESKD